jgi:hypothetical protein
MVWCEMPLSEPQYPEILLSLAHGENRVLGDGRGGGTGRVDQQRLLRTWHERRLVK